jgi:hypothetical protein
MDASVRFVGNDPANRPKRVPLLLAVPMPKDNRFRGAFQSATSVTLVDLSGGNAQICSEVSVGVEEWGWARGQCRS